MIGVNISLRQHKECFLTRLSTLVNRAVKANLSIRNRLKLITNHPVFGSNPERANRTRLYSNLDLAVRTGVRKILRLGGSAMPKSFYHLPIGKGGLGLPSFEDTIPGARSRLLDAFAAGEYSLVADNLFVDVAKMSPRAKQIAAMKPAERVRVTKDLRKKACSSLIDGTMNWLPGTSEYHTVSYNEYSGSSLISVVRLRTGKIGNKNWSDCRFCGRQRESLNHLVNARCDDKLQTYWNKRHDGTVSETAEFIKRRIRGRPCQLFVEKCFKVDSERFIRPDMVVIDRAKKILLVLDCHVTSIEGHNESGGESERLKEYRDAKRSRYEPHLPLILSQLSTESGGEKELDSSYHMRVIPLVVSMWGVLFPVKAEDSVEKVGIGDLRLLSRVATTAALRHSAKRMHELLWEDPVAEGRVRV